jgi:transcriptional regulator with XRE-family HTH domain
MSSAKATTRPTKHRPTFLVYWRERARNPKCTQGMLAEAIGVSTAHVSNIERGERQYTQETLELAVDYLRRWFPGLTVAHVLTMHPDSPEAAEAFDPEIAELVKKARRVQPSQRSAARAMLDALAVHGPSGDDEEG